jgi:DNA repair protein RecO
MAHASYRTEGFILGSVRSGESNKFFFVFTRDFGLLLAFAKSVREERSKLRYHLQDFSRVMVTVVRGKEIWRITGAETLKTWYRDFAEKPDTQRFFVQLCRVLRRLVQGQERHDALFDIIDEAERFLYDHSPDTEEMKTIEFVVMLRVLSALGYVAPDATLQQILDHPLGVDLLRQAAPFRRKMATVINTALQESQL